MSSAEAKRSAHVTLNIALLPIALTETVEPNPNELVAAVPERFRGKT
jgi:hypothetical protein